jgi:CofD-related protein of GAK system
LVFLSGGSALNQLAGRLAASDRHATHVISAFDNGGSSRWLREVFRCIAVGDIRNRLTSLSRPSANSAAGAVLELFRKRLGEDKPQVVLRQTVDALGRGSSDLLKGIPPEMHSAVSEAISAFLQRVPAKFDWRRGSVGNFLLVGRYLIEHERWEPALSWAHEVLSCVGSVVPVTTTSAHLGAELENGRVIVGQQRLTDQVHPIESPVKAIRLLRTDHNRVDVGRALPYGAAMEALSQATAIVYSWGSFYTSVLPALLVEGVAAAILARPVPRILLLNPFRDAELLGMTPAAVVRTLERYAAVAAGKSGAAAVTHVIALQPSTASKGSFYDARSLAAVEAAGVQVMTVQCDGLPEGAQIDEVIAQILGLAGVA